MAKRMKPSAPMIVWQFMASDLETKQHAAVLCFNRGYADQNHFDTLLLTMNLMLVAGQTDSSRKYALDYAYNVIKPALQSIKERAIKTNKFGVNSKEKKAITDMIEFSREFWNRQTSELWKFSYDQVASFYDECERKRA